MTKVSPSARNATCRLPITLASPYIWRLIDGEWTLYRPSKPTPGIDSTELRMGYIISRNGQHVADRHPVYCFETDSSNEYQGGTHKTLIAAMREVERVCEL